MDLNPEIVRRIAEMTIQERLREAERDRLVRRAEQRPSHSPWSGMGRRPIRRLGRFLIAMGLRLGADDIGTLPRGT